SNIGHTRAAAGIAGVIKMVQAIEHATLPRTLHAGEPTPHVDWAAGAVSVLTETRDWPRAGRPRRAAVSSFGISGTNAHVILEQPPTTEPAPAPASPPPANPVLWPLSAKSPAALRDRARQLLPLAGGEGADVGFSLATTRTTFGHRAVVTGDLRRGLEALAAGDPDPGIVTGIA